MYRYNNISQTKMNHKLELCKQLLWHIRNGAVSAHKPVFANAFAKLKDWYINLDEDIKNNMWEDDDYFTSILTNDNFYKWVFDIE